MGYWVKKKIEIDFKWQEYNIKATSIKSQVKTRSPSMTDRTNPYDINGIIVHNIKLLLNLNNIVSFSITLNKSFIKIKKNIIQVNFRYIRIKQNLKFPIN